MGCAKKIHGLEIFTAEDLMGDFLRIYHKKPSHFLAQKSQLTEGGEGGIIDDRICFAEIMVSCKK